MTVENLKAENDQLKTGGPSSRPPSSTSQSSGLGSLGISSPRQSVSSFGKTGMGQNEPYPGHTFTHRDFMLKMCFHIQTLLNSTLSHCSFCSSHRCVSKPHHDFAERRKSRQSVGSHTHSAPIQRRECFTQASSSWSWIVHHKTDFLILNFNWTSHILYRILLLYIYIIVVCHCHCIIFILL